MKKIICLALALLTVFALISCEKEHTPPAAEDIDKSTVASLESTKESDSETDYVLIDVKDYGKILVRLYPDVAPETVKNFKSLVSDGFYDGLIFHRVIKDFMIQGGDPEGTGMGGSDKNVVGEFASNGYQNPLAHERGVISMARSGSQYEKYLAYGYKIDELGENAKNDLERAYNSASGQFFIVHQNSPHLNGSYASFGMVVNGLDVVDKIAAVTTDESDKPHTDVVINSIRFVTVE